MSGTISTAEAPALLAKLVADGLVPKTMTAAEMIKDIDTDSSGNLSFNEFVDFYKKKGTASVKVLPTK